MDFERKLKTYKFTNVEKLEHTHTYFANKIYKLSIPADKRESFYQSYVDYIKQTPISELSKGPNCITEKSKMVNMFFVDLDVKMDAFEKGFISIEEIPQMILDILSAFQTVLTEAMGKDVDEPITAFRLLYKCHVYYPGLYFNVDQSKAICRDVTNRLRSRYPWMCDKKAGCNVIDESVYTSGLRLLYSHKGVMEKSLLEKDKHFQRFNERVPYNDIYRIGKITEKGTIEYEKEFSIEHLKATSIITLHPNQQNIPFCDAYVPLRKMNRMAMPVVSRSSKVKNGDGDVEMEDVEDSDGDNMDIEDDAATDVTFMIREYLEDVLPRFNMDPFIKAIKYEHNKIENIYVTLNPQLCPFAGRMHKRSAERNQPAHYVAINCFDRKIKCWDEDCSDQCFILPEPKEELMRHLQSSNKNYELKRALYRGTHESVAQYIFQKLKHDIAASPGGKTGYLWYYYDKDIHRWVHFEKIVSLIMEEHGPVQSGFKDFISQSIMDPNIPEDKVKVFKELWDDLGKKLEDKPYVVNGVIPLLARKFEYFWSKRAGEALQSFESRLDSNPELMGFTNGVFDFGKKEFRDGKPSDFISISTKNKYIQWDKVQEEAKIELSEFLHSVWPEEGHGEYVISELATSLNGTPNKQRFFIWTGGGANGKSSVIRLINLSFGDYAGEANATLFTKPRPPANCPCPELVSLKGLRFICISEPNAKESINLGTMKWITGGDRIIAAAKFRDNQSFYVQGTCLFLCNDIPGINASNKDFGTWRRIKPVSFNSKFCENPDLEKGEKPDDPLLNDKLKLWKETFASLLISTYMKAEVRPVPDEYHQLWKDLQNQNDVYGRFIEEFVKVDPDSFQERQHVFEGFSNWIKTMKFKKEISFDIFEKHMLKLLGPHVEHNGKKGWNINLSHLIPTIHF